MLPAVTVASMVLVAVLAALHFRRASAGAVAAVCFVLMPVVWLAAGGHAPQVVLVPCILVQLIGFERFHRDGQQWWLVMAGAVTGLMIWLHLAGVVLGPIYFVLGALALLPRRDRITAIGALALGFAAVAAPWVVAWLRSPQSVTEAINAYGLYDAGRFNLLPGVREMTGWTGLTVRSEMYWESFSPAQLFLGRGGLAQSLIGSSVFLLPFAIPLVRGLAAYLLHPRGAMDWMVLGALVAAPAAAALIAQPTAPRLIVLAPAAAIIATRGCYPGAFRRTVAASPATPLTAATST